jgi:uncharacterized protein YgiM (DUF1202 family)
LVHLQTSQPSQQLAQVSDCREVEVRTALNVRQRPNSTVIGTLRNGQTVTLADRPQNGWVEISSPIDGYVSTSYLTYCSGANRVVTTPTPTTSSEMASTVPGNNCRRIISNNVPIRNSPSGEIIGTLNQGQQIYIANEGNQGWVPIERPTSGYVSSANMGYCPIGTVVPEDENVATTPSSNCRRVVSQTLAVRQEPNGTINGVLNQNQNVLIANEGNNGWVPIEQPISGYVNAANLGYCS